MPAPGDPIFRPGEQLSARQLQEVADLAGRTQRINVSGAGSGSVSDGLSFVVHTDAEWWIMILSKHATLPHYSWATVFRDPDDDENWIARPEGPSASYAQIPAKEVNGRQDIEIFTVHRCWLGDDGQSLEFEAIHADNLTLDTYEYDPLVYPPVQLVVSGITEIQTDVDSGIRFYDPVPDDHIVRMYIIAADENNYGLMSTTAQRFLGWKYFNGNVEVVNGWTFFICDGDDSVAANTDTLYSVETAFGQITSYYSDYVNGKVCQTIVAPGGAQFIWLTAAGKWIEINEFGLRLDTGQKFGIGTDDGQTGTAGGSIFVGGLWVGGTHPGAGGGGGVSDGTYGDIIISGGGITWTVGPDAITTPKIAPAAVDQSKLSGNVIARMAAYG